jgi:medium-chain acyl-[acyl-carrier-protein] hydrolase
MSETGRRKNGEALPQGHPSPGIWTEDHAIRSYEVDPCGRLTVASFCNYMQEAAANHAHALGVSIQQLIHQNVTWVLSRLALRIHSYPGWGETIRVQTWPSGTRGPFSLRDFRLTGKNDRPLGESVTAWLLIDAKTRLPLRRVPFVSERLPHVKEEHPLSHDLGKLPGLDGHDHEETFRVRRGDLDLNRHVNNVCYIEWVMESLPPDMLDHAVPTDMEVNYIAEAFSGDRVLVRCLKLEGRGLSFLHTVLREGNGQELLRAKTAWRPRA